MPTTWTVSCVTSESPGALTRINDIEGVLRGWLSLAGLSAVDQLDAAKAST